jgi:hypothetical protein
MFKEFRLILLHHYKLVKHYLNMFNFNPIISHEQSINSYLTLFFMFFFIPEFIFHSIVSFLIIDGIIIFNIAIYLYLNFFIIIQLLFLFFRLNFNS